MNFDFQYDVAAAVMKWVTTKSDHKLYWKNYWTITFSYDIWNHYFNFDTRTRRATLAYSMSIPGICGPNRYTILEFNGFNESIESLLFKIFMN
jgi:hypothetical protein